MYKYQIVDPRKNGSDVEANTLGVEITVPEIADACDLGNIDPQHGCARGTNTEDDPTQVGSTSAILYATEAMYGDFMPPWNATLATIRPDLDAIGAMAVISLRGLEWDWGNPDEEWENDWHATGAARARIERVDASDNYVVGPWTGPTAWQVAPDEGSTWQARDLAAINAVCADRSLALDVRVAAVAAWILGGYTPTVDHLAAAAAACGSTPDAITAALSASVQATATTEQRREAAWSAAPAVLMHDVNPSILVPIAVVTSEQDALGVSDCYHLAPIGVALCAAWTWPQGHTTNKVTIAWRDGSGIGRAERERILVALNTMEMACGGVPKWGGGASILGSPQGLSTAIPLAEIPHLVSAALGYETRGA